jgi:hypothetical protein
MLFLIHAYGQYPMLKEWDYRYGGTKDEWTTSLLQTTEGGFVIGGFSYSSLSGDKTESNWDTTLATYDCWIVKIDSTGVKQWDKRFGGVADDGIAEMMQTADGGYILGGTSNSGISGDKTQPSWGIGDYWIVKTDSIGNKQWDKRYGGTGYDQFLSMTQTDDGGYILGGSSRSDISGDKTQNNLDPSLNTSDFWIVKIDPQGIKQWDKRYGGTGLDQLTSLTKTSDRGFILAGTSSSGISFDVTQANRGINDYWIIKVDSVGNKQWDKRFGGPGEEYLRQIRQDSDGGYLLGGESKSGSGGDKTQANRDTITFFPNTTSDYWIVKTDSFGNKLWDKRFGTSGNDELSSFENCFDGTYLLSGGSYASNGDKSEGNLGVENMWILKVGPSGNKIWDKTIKTNGHDEGEYALETPDGSYIMVNCSAADSSGYKSQSSWAGYKDYWVVKFHDTSLVAYASVATSSICEQTCIPFKNYSLNADHYLWSFPGGTPASDISEQPPLVCYNSIGNYNAQLIAYRGNLADTFTIPIVVHAIPHVNLGNDSSLCTGRSLTLNAGNAGASFLWQNTSSAQTLNINQGGTYWVKVYYGGCETFDTIQVTSVTTPAVNLGNDTSLCAPNAITLNATYPGATYHWQNNSVGATYVVSQTGNYSVTVTSFNCSAADGVHVTINTSPTIHFGSDTSICTNQPLVLNAGNPGASYLWQDNSTGQTFSINQTGIYWVTISKNGCYASDTIQVNSMPPPVVNLGNDTSICGQNTIVLNAFNSGASYHWQDNSASSSYSVVQTGLYSVTVTIGTCSVSDFITVGIYSPNVNLGNDTVVCDGHPFTLNAYNNGAIYQWQNGSSSSTLTVNQSGSYWVNVSINGCLASDTVHVTEISSPIVSVGQDVTVCSSSGYFINATATGAISYSWNDNSTDSILYPLSTGTYSVTVTSANHCTASDAINVIVMYNPGYALDASTCHGVPYFFNNHYLFNQGIYYDTIPGNQGCDTIVSFYLEVLPTPATSFSETICKGEGFFFQNQMYTLSGVYHDTLTASNGCDSVLTLYLQVEDTVYTISYLGTDTLVFSGSGTIQWFDCSNHLLTDDTARIFAPNVIGSFSAIITNNNCVDTSICYAVGVDNISETNHSWLTLRSNPASTHLYFDTDNNDITQINIYNSQGALVLQTKQPQTSSIEVSQLAKGVYIAEIKTRQKTFMKKWVKM